MKEKQNCSNDLYSTAVLTLSPLGVPKKDLFLFISLHLNPLYTNFRIDILPKFFCIFPKGLTKRISTPIHSFLSHRSFFNILITSQFNSVLILLGEIGSQSLLIGVKGFLSIKVIKIMEFGLGDFFFYLIPNSRRKSYKECDRDLIFGYFGTKGKGTILCPNIIGSLCLCYTAS